MARQSFITVLEKYPSQEATFIRLPFDPKSVWGSYRTPVVGTLNGHPFRTTTSRMGGVCHVLINREMRNGAGLQAGDSVSVEMERDDQPRTVQVPDDLERAFAENPAARDRWERLSFTHRREHVEAITSARKPETRARRIQNCIVMLTDIQP